MDIEKIASRIAGDEPAKLPTYTVIQHDGKGEVVAVTPNVSAASADEALAVVKDMARRGGGRFGKAVAIRTEDVERVAKGY